MQTIRPEIEAAIKERTDFYRNVTKRHETEERWRRLMDDNQRLIDREATATRWMLWIIAAGLALSALVALTGCCNA